MTGAARMFGSRTDPVDEIAVERAVAGDAPMLMNLAERRQAAEVLTRRGYSVRQIARMLQMTPRSVTRYRAEARR